MFICMYARVHVKTFAVTISYRYMEWREAEGRPPSTQLSLLFPLIPSSKLSQVSIEQLLIMNIQLDQPAYFLWLGKQSMQTIRI